MPGKYKYDWDGSHLPNGQYLIWLDNDLAPYHAKIYHKQVNSLPLYGISPYITAITG